MNRFPHHAAVSASELLIWKKPSQRCLYNYANWSDESASHTSIFKHSIFTFYLRQKHAFISAISMRCYVLWKSNEAHRIERNTVNEWSVNFASSEIAMSAPQFPFSTFLQNVVAHLQNLISIREYIRWRTNDVELPDCWFGENAGCK